MKPKHLANKIDIIVDGVKIATIDSSKIKPLSEEEMEKWRKCFRKRDD